MLYVLRNLLSILALPVTAMVIVPLWIARRFDVRLTPPETAGDWLFVVAGVAVLAGGFALFGASLHNFFVYGQGTLAPWDPPRRLVVRGPYRYVRNPMISGVLFVLTGTALLARSLPHALWALGFLALNATYIPLVEEPMLARRFGADYDTYRRLVPRFVPARPHPKPHPHSEERS